MLKMRRISRSGIDVIDAAIDTLVLAGWAERDTASIRRRIEERSANGITPPSSVPIFYRVGAGTLTQTSRLDVLGPDTYGEIEPVLVALDDGLWVGIGSDHSDRAIEPLGIALSRQLCGKVVGPDFWRYEEIADHWDLIEMKSHIVVGGVRTLNQEGRLAALRSPVDLIERWSGKAHLQPGTVMFGGTLGAVRGVRPADRFEMELHDPAFERSIRHAYDVTVLPIVS